MMCLGTTVDGDRCGLPAGWGTDSEWACRWHEVDVRQYGVVPYGRGPYGGTGGGYGASAYGSGSYG